MWDRAAAATDRRLATVSASLCRSLLKAAGRAEAAAAAPAVVRQRTPPRDARETREGDSRHFISGERKRGERLKERGRSSCRRACC